MLPDFPDLKRRLLTITKITFEEKVREDGLIRAINQVPYFEGDRFETQDVEGDKQTSSPKQMSIPITVERTAIVEEGVGAYVKVMMNAVTVQQQNLVQMLHERMDEVTERTGNRVDAGGQPFSPSLFLDLLEKIDIDFDEYGQPDLSSVRIVVLPELGEVLREKGPEWETDPVLRKRRDEIIAKKRIEWSDRESNRKLVD
ncbi:MAG: hypothetical protein HZB13_01785 [Acidobacteria bacterium]|nr:hypothetical protein [Acidobacteriota bacterium]